ncbi:MAG: mechanosensitive ion channel [Lamprobacter sp.]|uniref:mechanosensitive ion channel domain-containing protein n=1 Tax=Lamprobacter sp. TaxID=3100796 RepID=UPI002B263002|nr:mechanosensitive ion channel domain-containing protein [Lamprobacter sp.]MEA3639987.1 mechanosensitive ion channel [Lamprobacter sp.]
MTPSWPQATRHQCRRAPTRANPAPAFAALLLAVLLPLAGLLLGTAMAQTEPPAETGLRIQPTVLPAQIEAKLKALEENQDLSEDTEKQLTELYRSALNNLEQLDSFQMQARSYFETLEQAPSEAAALRLELESLTTPSDPPIALPETLTIADIEQLLAREQAEAASIEAQLSNLNETLSAQSDELVSVRRRLTEAPQELTEIDEALKRPQPEGQTEETRQARVWALETERDALRAEMLMLDQQILSADARRQLAEAQREQRAAALQQLRLRRAYLENEADRLRNLEAERARQETESAERELGDADPLLRQLAQQNRQISETISSVTDALGQLDEQQAGLEERLRETQTDLKDARARISAAGLSQAVGQILVDERADLPDASSLRKQAAARAEKIAELTLSQLRLTDGLRRIENIDEAVARTLPDAEEADDLAAEQRAQLESQLRKQLLRQRDLLQRALRLQESYQRAIGDLDFTAEQYADLVNRYRDFLAEHLLWVRSAKPITQQSFTALPEALWWMIAPAHWASVVDSLAEAMSSSALLWIGLLLVIGLLASGPWMRRRIRSYIEPMRRISTDRFGYTVSALGLTLLLALPWPLLSLLLGWQLSLSQTASPFALAVGEGLLRMVIPFYYLRAFRLLCMPGGVAARHFRWGSRTLFELRRGFQIAALLLLPIGFIAETISQAQNPAFDGTLVRLALVLLCLGLAALTAWLIHPSRGVFHRLLAEQPEGWLNRLRFIWYPLAVFMPTALAALALAGFIYTAGTLLASVAAQLWLALALVVLHQLIVRWLIITRRGLALEAALDRRAQREAQREALEQGAQRIDPIDDSVDLAALDSQTRKLLNSSMTIMAMVGVWIIWSDVLPALNLFHQVTLWHYTATVDGIKELVPVTLADIGLVLVTATAALIAVNNLPALLEILLLKNTEVSPSGRYTLVTLTRYLITAFGLLLIVTTLGLQWSQVQWLVAALSVGIGFGLQEIVANFISGLIILFERPVRVGDTVTIGDTTGTVTRIQIRATTIRNWDKQELLVPNKEFITGRLLNWTLTDQINRLVIAVGIEYGSDTRKALALLAEAAAEHPKILDDPAPLITFEGFGNNALNLFLRCYLETLEFRLTVITELHQAIDDKFRAAGIGIAFPQRDLHLRSAAPVEIMMRGPTLAAGPAPTGSAPAD